MRRALLHARLTAGATLGDVLAVHLDCLADREQEVRWLVLGAGGTDDVRHMHQLRNADAHR